MISTATINIAPYETQSIMRAFIAEKLEFTYNTYEFPSYRFLEGNGLMHDGGFTINTPETVVDDETFEAFLIDHFGLTKI